VVDNTRDELLSTWNTKILVSVRPATVLKKWQKSSEIQCELFLLDFKAKNPKCMHCKLILWRFILCALKYFFFRIFMNENFNVSICINVQRVTLEVRITDVSVTLETCMKVFL
jgi:hypothetical protein